MKIKHIINALDRISVMCFSKESLKLTVISIMLAPNQIFINNCMIIQANDGSYYKKIYIRAS